MERTVVQYFQMLHIFTHVHSFSCISTSTCCFPGFPGPRRSLGSQYLSAARQRHRLVLVPVLFCLFLFNGAVAKLPPPQRGNERNKSELLMHNPRTSSGAWASPALRHTGGSGPAAVVEETTGDW